MAVETTAMAMAISISGCHMARQSFRIKLSAMSKSVGLVNTVLCIKCKGEHSCTSMYFVIGSVLSLLYSTAKKFH